VEEQDVKISFLEVGHGDSIVITYPDGITASIIDTPDPRVTYDYLIDNNIQQIDWIIVSHGDSDHYRGIASLINNLYSQDIYVNKLGYIRGDKKLRNEKGYNLLRQQFVEFQDTLMIETIEPYSVTIPVLSEVNGMKLHCLYPYYAADVDSAGDEPNNWSIVLRIEYCGKTVLLPGDLEGHGWFRLRTHTKRKGINLQSDALKLPHHGRWFSGNKTSMDLEEVVNLVSASICVVSAGYSRRLSCPSKETVNIIKDDSELKRFLCTGCGSACHNGNEISDIPESYSLGKSRYSSKLPCGGNITLQISNGILNLFPSEEDHNRIIKQLDHPLCR
jgi:competence protein ComEC